MEGRHLDHDVEWDTASIVSSGSLFAGSIDGFEVLDRTTAYSRSEKRKERLARGSTSCGSPHGAKLPSNMPSCRNQIQHAFACNY